jgi:iron complex transport system ATP-binding protein
MHDLNLAAAYCDRLWLLDQGRVVASGTPEQVLRPELVEQAFRVSAHIYLHPITGRPQLAFHRLPHS